MDPSKPELDEILRRIHHLTSLGERIMSALDDLTASVAANTTVIGSALTLIQGFSAALAAAGTDPAKLAALKATVDSSDQALAAAVAANTPAAPVSPAPVTPAPTTP